MTYSLIHAEKDAKAISHNKQRNIYIQDNKNNYVSNVFPVFFTIFERYPDELRVAF